MTKLSMEVATRIPCISRVVHVNGCFIGPWADPGMFDRRGPNDNYMKELKKRYILMSLKVWSFL